MKIVALVENTCANGRLEVEHGLCLYVETPHHRLLLDSGASDLFLKNAGIMHTDLSLIDTVVLSHGHNDHGGGLSCFLQCNSVAKIYMQTSAFGEYYSIHEAPKFIGLDSELKKTSRIVMLNGYMRIDDELEIFAGIVSNRPVPSANGTLKIKTGTGFVQDDFRHEQCLVITVGEKRILLSGCAHHGILNILDEFRSIYETEPDVVISGFHLKKKTAYTADDIREIRGIARELKSFRSVFYTCHCTGEEAFAVMKEVMGGRLHYLHCGDVLEF